MLKNVKKYLLVFIMPTFIFISLNSCTISSTKPFNPTFVLPRESLKMSLDSILPSDQIDIAGRETSKNTKKIYELTIDLTTNTDNSFPQNLNMADVAKQIASKVKNSISNSQIIDIYLISFIEKDYSNKRNNVRRVVIKSEDIAIN